MAWGIGFVNQLKKSIVVPKYELRFHENPTGPSGVASIFGGYGHSPNDGLTISSDGPIINGTSVIPISWNVTFGGFSVPVIGDIRKYYPTLLRGTFASLFVTLNGFTERVAFGQLRNISGKSGIWTLQFVDIISAMAVTANAEIDISETVEKFKWFFNTGHSTQLAADYSGGNTTMTLVDGSKFEQETGQDGLLKITSSANPTCYATWTSKASANVLNLTSATIAQNTIYPGTEPIPASNTVANTTITSVAFLKGKPWEIMGKLLISREGNSLNPFDKYPASWCAGGNFPEDIYDDWDAKQAEDYIHAGGSYTYGFGLAIESPWDGGFREFVDTAATLAQWPVWRQDSVSWRGARILSDTDIEPAAKISAHDIIEIMSHEYYDASCPNAYRYIRLNWQERKSGSSTTIEKTDTTFGHTQTNNIFQTLPTFPKLELNAQYIYQSSNQTSYDGARAQMALRDGARMLYWANSPVEKVVLKLPIHFAYLCCGDVVQVLIKSEHLHSYQYQAGLDWYHDRYMVTGISFSFYDAFCIVTLSKYGFLGDF